MIPEIGHFFTIFALNCALVLGLLPILGIRLAMNGWITLIKPLTHLHLVCIAIGFSCLCYSFIQHDFSVAYVVRNSNSYLPLLYRISGVWGAHEGSLLLWVLCLAVWMSLVAVFGKPLDRLLAASIVSVMSLVSVGFLTFLLLTSNPFLRLFPYPLDGNELNPLLQDPGLAIHPPLLYMGYVGFSVAFAFAVSVLILGKLEASSLRWLRPWVLSAWVFLTSGITLGSFWAYYELGWGGWWFWDPVENSSFMPWLLSTALIHSLLVSERKMIFINWTLLLAVCTFSLSLLGTFLVRSGVLTSVHAFASDPARGLFILIFLSVVVGSSLVLFAHRAHLFSTVNSAEFLSRDFLLWSNSVLLTITVGCILLGTLYPLAFDALGLGKLSVGAPYFNTVFFPLTAPLLFLLGFGVSVPWSIDDKIRFSKKLLILLLCAGIVAGTIVAGQSEFKISAFIGCLLASWVLITSSESFLTQAFSTRLMGMSIAHIGLAVFTIGVSMSSSYSLEKNVMLKPGESVDLLGYTLLFRELQTVQIENYTAKQAMFFMSTDGRSEVTLLPQKRLYNRHKMPMTELAIYAGVFKDILVAMGEPIATTDNWSFRIYYKAFVRWIWAGGFLMAFGGLIATCSGGYRQRNRVEVDVKI